MPFHRLMWWLPCDSRFCRCWGWTVAGADKEALFLTKLVLLLANASGDWAQVEQTIAEALCNL